MAKGLLSNLFNAATGAASAEYRGLPQSEREKNVAAAATRKHASPLANLVPRPVPRLGRSSRWILLVVIALTASLAFFSSSSKRIAGQIVPGQLPSHMTLTREQLDSLKFHIPSANASASKSAPKRDHSELRMRIFMPADSPSMRLCKEVMSAMALGYPAPTILNWKGEFNRPDWHLAGSHIAKLDSLLNVIETALNSDGDFGAVEDDVAVLVDAYDVWFQLPPVVLLQRFHQINNDANKRMKEEWEALQKDAPYADFPIPPPRQNIIVSSAKDCFPLSDSGSDPHYDHWPESPMPDNMYGEGTDKVLPGMDASRKYKNIRPRCVNSGMIMGTMGALRLALKRAKIKVEDAARSGRQLWSDQALFGEVIGDQEMWREYAREMASTWDGSSSNVDMSRLDNDVRRLAAVAMEHVNFEFGIGLDYGFATIPPTCSAEEDGYFVQLNDKQALNVESIKAGVPGGEVRVNGIPPELRKPLPSYDNLRDIQWGDLPLYTDFFFGTTPVGIHHNAFVGGLKESRIRDWWQLMWFYPYLREILTKQLQPVLWGKKYHPIANVTGENGEEYAYWRTWPDEHEKVVKVFEPVTKDRRDASFRSIPWDNVCQVQGSPPWHRELLGDGKGRLII